MNSKFENLETASSTIVLSPKNIEVSGSTPLDIELSIEKDGITQCSELSFVIKSSNEALVSSGALMTKGSLPSCKATLNIPSSAIVEFEIEISAYSGKSTAAIKVFIYRIRVSPVNQAPTLAAISNITTNEDTLASAPIEITDSDNTLTCSSAYITFTSSNLTVLPLSGIAISGTYPHCTLQMTPALNQTGVSNISVVVNDHETSILPFNQTATRSFSLTVTSVNDAPVVSAISNMTMNEDTSQSVSFTVSDESTLNCTATHVSFTSSNTTLLPLANIVRSGTYPNCQLQFTPVANLFGVSTITLTVQDNEATVSPLNQSTVKTFTVTVNNVNDTPVGNTDTVYVLAGTSFLIDVLANDTDLDGDVLTINTVSTTAAKGTATLETNKIRYAAGAGMYGLDSFTYTARDPSLASTATITVNVKIVNPFTWTGNGGNTTWSNVANWCGSVNATGTGCIGQTVAPSASSSVYFDGTCSTNCSPRMPASFASLTNLIMDSGYTGTVMADTTTAGSGMIISGDFSFSGGTLEIGNTGYTKNLQVGGTLSYTGGTFVDKGCGESLMADPNRCFIIGTIRIYANSNIFCDRATSAQNLYIQKQSTMETCGGKFYSYYVNLDVGTTLSTGAGSSDQCFTYSTILNNGTISDNGSQCPASGGYNPGGGSI